MTVRARIRKAMAGGLLLMLLSALVAGHYIQRIRVGGPIQTDLQLTSDLVADILPPPAYLIESFLEVTLLRQDVGRLEEARKRLQTLQADYRARQGFWREAEIDPALKSALTDGSAKPGAAFWAEVNERFLPAIAGGDQAAADASYRRISGFYAAHRREIDRTVTLATERQTAQKADAAFDVRLALGILGGVGLLLVGLMAVAGRYVTASVIGPLGEISSTTRSLADGGRDDVPFRNRPDELGELARAVQSFKEGAEVARANDKAKAELDLVIAKLSEALDRLRNGDLDAYVTADFPGDYAVLKADYNNALAALSGIIASVSVGMEALMTGAGQVSEASQELARRTESGAASLEETGAALREVDSTVQSSARNTQDSVEKAAEALLVVAAGRETTDEAVSTMERVLASAQDIDHVIEALDKIAFQTRVLAMNAAVEAGRAGEAGRGFAVVADLVSALAMRAEEEARLAREKLTATREEIGAAVEAVGRTDGSFAAIVDKVEGVQQMLSGIASASAEQASALAEVNMAVGSAADTTQATAAMVEETAAASAQMMAQIRDLEGELARFSGHGARPPEAGAARATARQPASLSRRTENGPQAVVAYDRRRRNIGYQVVLDEAPTGPLN